MNKCHRCNYFFRISFDPNGFYIVPGLGNKTHSHHNKICSSTIRDVDDINNKLMEDMGKGKAKPSTIQNTIFNKTGQLVPRSKIRHLTGYDKRCIMNNDDFDILFPSNDPNDLSSSDRMVKFCRNNGYHFQLLLNDPIFSSSPISETHHNRHDEPLIEENDDFTQNELKAINENINKGRKAKKLLPHHKYMMAFCWMLPDELSLLEAFSHVVFIDVTEKTNNEKRPLLTAGFKDSHGNTIIFYRYFMPNQQAWMFRWVFSVSWPRLIPKHILDRIKLILSDGDQTEYNQIDNAIKKYMPHVYRGRCGWHVIFKGIEKRVDTTFPDLSKDVKDKYLKFIKNWCYSWMKIDCQTYMQFKYSYHLLCKFLYSKKVIDLFGIPFANNFTLFLRKHVFVWETYILFYYRRNIRHYEEYNNSPLEGTNTKLKHSDNSTHPQLRLETSFEVMNQQAEKKVQQVINDVITSSQTVCDLNVNDDVYDQLTRVGAELLRTLRFRSEYYICARVKYNVWKSTRSKDTYKESDTIIELWGF